MIMMRPLCKLTLCSMLGIVGGILQPIWAAAPVIDLNQVDQEMNNAAASPLYPDSDQSPTVSPRRALSAEERMRLLEQQISNLTQMNLPGKIDSLQQQLQQITGQIEVLGHDIQTLQAAKTQSTANPPAAAVNAPTPTSAETEIASKIAQAEANVTRNAPSTQKAPAASEVAPAGSEENAYKAAFNLLANKKNAQALAAFQAFLKTYPKGTHAPNAHYWLGELYANEHKNDLATEQFTTLIQKFPSYRKVPDVMLKLAIIHAEAGQPAQAQQELQKIVTRYPNSAAARLAQKRLKETQAPT